MFYSLLYAVIHACDMPATGTVIPERQQRASKTVIAFCPEHREASKTVIAFCFLLRLSTHRCNWCRRDDKGRQLRSVSPHASIKDSHCFLRQSLLFGLSARSAAFISAAGSNIGSHVLFPPLRSHPRVRWEQFSPTLRA
jgi:hypothetical protein